MSSSDVPKKELPPNTGPPPPPNGGFAAWLGVFGAFLLFITTWGFSTAFGAFQFYYQSDLLKGHSSSQISWVGTVNAFFLVSTGIMAGPLFDRGYLIPLMITGCLMTTFGLMMLSLSTEYYQVLLSQGFCCGIGSGLIYVPALSLMSTNFTTRRAIALGFVTCGASIGGVIFPIIFIRLQPQIGFPWTVRTMGFIQLFLSCVAVPLLMLRPHSKNTNPRSLIHWVAFRELNFDVYAIANFLLFMAYFIPIFYVPFYALSVVGTSTHLAFYMLSILNAGSAIGRLTAAYMTRTIGAPIILAISIFGATIMLFGWIGAKSVGSFAVFCVLFGLFSGVLISTDPLVVAHPVICPSPSVVGTRMGMQWFIISLGILIGAPIGGQIQSHGSDGYLHVQLFAAIVMAAGSVLLLKPLFAVWRFDRAK